MPMDGFTLSFLQRELHQLLAGGRVDKVNQPERDTLLLMVRSQGHNRKLLLSANANHARAQLTGQSYENPAEPPMFCMLMRKHLLGSRIISIAQIKGDRILTVEMEGMNELADKIPFTLYLEIMGRHSNLILVNGRGTIVDSIKHVSGSMSRVRTVLPGQSYRLPPDHGKLNPQEITAAQIFRHFSPLVMPFQKALSDSVTGLAAVCAKEICAQLNLDDATSCHQLDWALTAPLLEKFFASLPERHSPVILVDENSLVLDFFPFPYRTYTPERQMPQASLSEAMDAYYAGRDLRLRLQQRSADLQKHIKNARSRLEKKMDAFRETIVGNEHAAQHRIFGELLTAHLHLVEKGADMIRLPNYYDPQQAPVEIPLSAQLTPAQNAQSYYKKYRKAKIAGKYAIQQLQKAETELFVLENAFEDLEKCDSSADLFEIRQVLVENGFLKPESTKRKREKKRDGEPYRFLSPDGTEIVVGKNALQNDRLTHHAQSNELWLHAQGMPGSHIIIRTVAEPGHATLLLAAKLAAYFSRGRNLPALPVDYTLKKHVKKASGSVAGFVTYTHYQTISVSLTPEDRANIARAIALPQTSPMDPAPPPGISVSQSPVGGPKQPTPPLHRAN